MTIQLKATEQYFPVELFIMLYEVVLMFFLRLKSQSVAIQMKATEQYNVHVPSGRTVYYAV